MAEKANAVTVEDARKVLAAEEQKRREEFRAELRELLARYGYGLTARFELFGAVVDPPVRVVRVNQTPQDDESG